MNGYSTKQININWGVRQGCPMSPLIFDLALEPLTIMIRASQEIEGVTIGNMIIEMGIYGADVVCCLTNPVNSFRKLTRVLENFGVLSGYKINQEKTVLMCLSRSEAVKKEILEIVPCRWCKESVQYLGILIGRSHDDTLERNIASWMMYIQGK